MIVTAAAEETKTVVPTYECFTHAEPINMRHRIGSTVYEVNIYFNKETKETLDDKILRLAKNDLRFASKNDRMVSLQTEQLPERSSA